MSRYGIKRLALSSIVDSTRPYAVLHTTLLRSYAFCETLIIRFGKIDDDIDDIIVMKSRRLSSKCLVWGAGQIPPAARLRMEAATEEWKGERLGSLLGFRHTKAPNQITGYLCRLFFAESTRDSVVEAVSNMRGWGSAYRREMQTGEKDALRKLLQRLGVIGRVIASDSHIKVYVVPEVWIQRYAKQSYTPSNHHHNIHPIHWQRSLNPVESVN